MSEGKIAAVPDPRPEGVGRLGTWLLIASLGMLFASALVGYLVIRLRAPDGSAASMLKITADLMRQAVLVLAEGEHA